MNLTEALLTGKNVTMGDALATGTMVAGVGLSIVFGVLVILMLVLMLFKVIFYRDPAKQAKKEAAKAAPTAPVAETAPVKDDMDEAELIAVLTAAVAASLNTSTYNLQIKSYKRVDPKKPAWNKAGIRETIGSRF